MTITIIGTSHIARESINRVKKTIEEQKPDIVAVELDYKRLYALTHRAKQRFSFYNVMRVGVKGFLFGLVGSWVSKKLGRMVGVDPGDEMKTAIRLARKHNIQIALIDQDIEITLAKFSKYLTWSERWKFVKDIFNGIFFREKEMKKYGLHNLDLSKVPPDKLVKKMIGMIKTGYPSIYRVLIEERNQVMANNLKRLIAEDPTRDRVAVVGAGHVDGIKDILGEPSYSYGYVYEGSDGESLNLT